MFPGCVERDQWHEMGQLKKMQNISLKITVAKQNILRKKSFRMIKMVVHYERL